MPSVNPWGTVEDSLYGAGSGLQQFADGIGRGVKELVCRTYRNYPGWAMGPKLLTAFGRGFMDSACKLPLGEPPTPRPPTTYPAGQCPVVYDIKIRPQFPGCDSMDSGGVYLAQFLRIAGPIQSVTEQAFDSDERLVVARNTAGEVASVRVFNRCGALSYDYFRVDGQPDNCGEGTIQLPPATEPPEGDKYYDFNIPITIGPNSFSIPISLGPIAIPISPSFEFSPVFIVPIGEPGDRPEDRQPLIVTPDGVQTDLSEVYRRLQENQDQLQRNNADIQQALENISEVAECVCIDVSRTVRGYSCDPAAMPLELQVSGRGITAVVNFLDAINAQNNEQTRQLCPGPAEPPEQVPPIRMANGTMSFSNRVEIVPVGPDVVSIALVITGYDNKLLSVVSVDNNHGVDAKFGSLSWGLYGDGLRGGGTLELVYQRSTYIRMGRHLKERAIRIALKPGVSWELYDTGERENG